MLLSRYNLKRRVASLPPISSEVFTEKVLQARATTTLEAERAGFQKECSVCQRTYYSENSYQNHIGSQKHKAKEAASLRRQHASAANGGVPVADDASSVISSTFTLGEPVAANTSDVDSDADAEQEFSNIVESMKKTGIQERQKRPSPVKRPSHPQPSDDVQQKEDHPMSEESSEHQQSSTATPIPSKTVSLKSCLFCNLEASDIDSNVSHMERVHGMFIPEKQYLVNLEGLLASLQERIQEYNECLVCGKVKSNAFAAQTHMRDTGHCKIPYTTEDEQLEIGEFYDFRSTYSDDDGDDDYDSDEESAHGGARLGGKRPTTVTDEDGDVIADGQDEGWETDSSASSLDSADLTAVPAENHYHQYERLGKHPHHARSESRPHHDPRDGKWHSHTHSHRPTRAVFYDEYELHLPSGRSVGHRSLNTYYRQNLRDRPTPVERAQRQLAIENGEDPDGEEGEGREVARRGRDLNRQLATRADGGSGMAGVADGKKSEVKKAEVRSRKAVEKQNRRLQWSTNKAANNQKYYHYSIL